MSLQQSQITIRNFADMLEDAGPGGVEVTHYPNFDIHRFIAGKHAGTLVFEDLDETYVMLSKRAEG